METPNGLIVHQAAPLNAEPPLEALVASHITGAAQFFVRTHGSVPEIDPATFALQIGGRVRAPLWLSLADLKERFAEQRVVASPQ